MDWLPEFCFLKGALILPIMSLMRNSKGIGSKRDLFSANLFPTDMSRGMHILVQVFVLREESFEKLERCLEKLRHSLVHLMKNDLTQELKLRGV